MAFPMERVFRMFPAACLLAFVQAHAQPQGINSAGNRNLTLYGSRLISNDLPQLGPDILRGRLGWRDSYFVGAGYSLPLGGPGWLPRRTGLSSSVEFIGVRHFGQQENLEVDIAYMLHTARGEWGGLKFRGGGGIGPSLALGRPAAEDGPTRDPDRRSRFQHYIALEIEAALSAHPDTALVLRVHHRSGVYGLVAPDGVGSNFMTLGLRYAF